MDAPGQGTASRDLRFLSELTNSSKSDDSLLKDKMCAVEAMHRRMVFEGINEIGLCDSCCMRSTHYGAQTTSMAMSCIFF